MRARSVGFTLIELVIVIAILGIIMVIAVPAFQDQMRRSRRTVAKTDLSDCALKQERWRASHPAYGTMAEALCATAVDNYTYAVVTGAGPPTTFTVTATARNAQAGDTGCTTLTINDTNVKTPAACWGR